MNKLLTKLFLLFIFCLFGNAIWLQSKVFGLNYVPDTHMTRIDSINEIIGNQPNKTIYFFDIDDTLIDSPYMLGSKAWRKYIAEATKHDTTQNWHDVFTFFLAQHYPVKAIESDTTQFIKNLQMNQYSVFALTARERNKWYDTDQLGIDVLTSDQLATIELNLHQNQDFLIQPYSYLTDAPEYYKGILFADIEPKGEYLLKLFQNSPELPAKVIFVDDKYSQVESVAAALQLLGIDYECYWYPTTDVKASKFDPLIANIQLYYFWTSDRKQILSDEEALSIAEQYPEKNAEHYLQLVLDGVKIPIIRQ